MSNEANDKPALAPVHALSELRALAADVVAIARRAGDAILDIYGEDDFRVQTKDDASPLTAADLAAHRIIADALRERTPDIPVLSEESESLPFAERALWPRFWLVDPLDGTKEFIKRNGEFTVNIALIEGHTPRLGVVHLPAQAATYVGVVGDGATKQMGSDEPQPIRVRPAPDSGLRVAVSRSHPSEALTAFIDELGECETIPLGSALKLCYVAEGDIDLYPRLGPTSEWDIGAAQAVLEAAGGRVVCVDGSPLSYGAKESLLNPYFFALGDAALLPRVLALAPQAS
ncbi:3'(2'),5'-bisphosphate nucleotidase CysQ [Haliangium ochraceum]|uniref:3'(2'),5'-bisphosphate nucleotidase CysQ n=1 Tax=Haliangium ochraceum (strain DSM 14365 / JCM 11303 / SMP-2) TaxID=502025 RepID=D0LVI4_HALO1|nr:3'(2'),5'-bisphosphate nucleotidase CysQ [Haliangium ochraceum]ACY17545.1 3'(2'),5'-bisphosphate nucleotidase [Haliangium ochraceum DSM 14365]